MYLRELNQLISPLHKTKAALVFVQDFRINCPDYPRAGYKWDIADHFVGNFSHHALRALYYSELFAVHLSRYLKEQEVRDRIVMARVFTSVDSDTDEGIKIKIDNDVFFDFDAFVFAAKTLSDKNVRASIDELSQRARSALLDYYCTFVRTYVKPVLNRFRNEIVHVGDHGSSTFPTALVQKNGDVWAIFLPSAFQAGEGSVWEITALFDKIFRHTIEQIWKTSGCFLLHYIEKLGLPDRVPGFETAHAKVEISDFDIPGFSTRGVQIVELKDEK